MISFPHTCYFLTEDQKLSYDGGTAAFNSGKIVTGATSHATGTIKSISGNATSGYLILSNVSGTFLNNEALSDNGTVPGAALADGTNADYVDSYGKKTYTVSATSTSCRFCNLENRAGDLDYGWTGFYPAALFPPTVSVSRTDEGTTKIYSTVSGFSGYFLVEKVTGHNPHGSIHHWTVALKAVT